MCVNVGGDCPFQDSVRLRAAHVDFRQLSSHAGKGSHEYIQYTTISYPCPDMTAIWRHRRRIFSR